MSQPTHPSPFAVVLTDERHDGHTVSSHETRADARWTIRNLAGGYAAAVDGEVNTPHDDVAEVVRDGAVVATYTVRGTEPAVEPLRRIRVGRKVATGPWQGRPRG